MRSVGEKKVLPNKLSIAVQEIITKYPQVKLLYFFGSAAAGNAGPLSDLDFAAYVDEKDAAKRLDLRLHLMGELSARLETDKIDVLLLNDINSSEIKANIIKEGILLFKEEPYKVIIEQKIMSEYLDFSESLRQFGAAAKAGA